MADSPFLGPSYSLKSLPASVQRTINLMPVPQEPGNERTAWVFKDVEGLVRVEQPFAATLEYTSTGADFEFSAVVISEESMGPVTYAWDFGDGDTSTAQNPSHTYAAVGDYTVELVVTNDTGSITITEEVTYGLFLWETLSTLLYLSRTNGNERLVDDAPLINGTSAQAIAGTALTGKKYFEIEVAAAPTLMPVGIGIGPGVTASDSFYNTAYVMMRGGGGCGQIAYGTYSGGTPSSNAAYSFVAGDKIGIAFDATTGKLWFRKNGTWIVGDPVAGTGQSLTAAAGTYYPYVGHYTCNSVGGLFHFDIHSKVSAQDYAVPTGFTAYDPS